MKINNMIGVVALICGACYPWRGVWADEISYGQCLSKYLGQTKSKVAVDSIYDACDKINRGDQMMFNGKGRYYECVASSLKGVGRDYAVAKIKELCLDKYRATH